MTSRLVSTAAAARQAHCQVQRGKRKPTGRPRPLYMAIGLTHINVIETFRILGESQPFALCRCTCGELFSKETSRLTMQGDCGCGTHMRSQRLPRRPEKVREEMEDEESENSWNEFEDYLSKDDERDIRKELNLTY